MKELEFLVKDLFKEAQKTLSIEQYEQFFWDSLNTLPEIIQQLLKNLQNSNFESYLTKYLSNNK